MCGLSGLMYKEGTTVEGQLPGETCLFAGWQEDSQKF